LEGFLDDGTCDIVKHVGDWSDEHILLHVKLVIQINSWRILTSFYIRCDFAGGIYLAKVVGKPRMNIYSLHQGCPTCGTQGNQFMPCCSVQDSCVVVCMGIISGNLSTIACCDKM
jgi:hypothetical protein